MEQHPNHRWMLQADWFSATHDLAYLIPGIVYRATPHWMVSLGYQIPNKHSNGLGQSFSSLQDFRNLLLNYALCYGL